MAERAPSSGLTEELPPDAEKTLVGIELLADEDPATIDELEAAAKWYFCPEDGTIFDRDDPGREVYFIVRGKVRVVDHAESGQEIAFDDREAGKIVGELSALDGQPRSATLVALEDTVLAVVPEDVFAGFVEAHPDVALRLMQHFVRDIRTLNDRIVGLSSTTVLQRVYEQILKLAEPDPLNPRRLYIETLPRHRDIAIWAGTTPETVARALGRLIEANVARRLSKSLHILDPERLQKLVDAT